MAAHKPVKPPPTITRSAVVGPISSRSTAGAAGLSSQNGNSLTPSNARLTDSLIFSPAQFQSLIMMPLAACSLLLRGVLRVEYFFARRRHPVASHAFRRARLDHLDVRMRGLVAAAQPSSALRTIHAVRLRETLQQRHVQR